jgi:type II secretory pathway pseudopilin PulG
MHKRIETGTINPRSRAQSGFTLVELLIATTFFTFILLFITAGFIQVSRTYQSGVITKNAQNTARVVFEQLARDARTGTDIQVVSGGPGLQCYIIGEAIYGYEPAPTYRLLRGSSGCALANMQLMHESNLKIYAFELQDIKALPTSGSPSSAKVNILLGIAESSLLTGTCLATTCQPSPTTLRLCSVVTMSTAVTLRGDT